MGKKKSLIPLSLFLSALSALLSIVPFIIIWIIVKHLITETISSNSLDIYTYAWWALAAAVLSIILYFGALCLSHIAAFHVETNIRRIAMHKIIQLPLGFFDNNSSGRIRKIIDDDASTTHTFLAHQLPDMAGTLLTPIVTLILIFGFDWRLGIACCIPIIISMITMQSMMRMDGKQFQKKYFDALEEMSSESVEYVRGIPIVKIFQQSIFSFKRFYNSILNYKKMVIAYTKLWSKPMSLYTVVIQSFAFFLIPTAILLIGHQGNASQIIIDMILYLLITPTFAVCIMRSMHLNQNKFIANEAITRIEKLINEETLTESTQPQKIQQHSISFKHVAFKYPQSESLVLQDISFTIPQGKSYALVGPSGGGKTTIARLIPRFWDSIKGSVQIGDCNVKDLSSHDLMQHISFVFQNTKLFKTTLLENLQYGNPNANINDIHKAIDQAQCREIIDRLPLGLDTKIGSEGTYLSGGEQQRFAIARAIIKNAPIVILDEATAFTDPENEHLIQKAFKKLTEGKTVLTIAHRLTSIQHVDRILVVEKGQIVEQGNHAELLQQSGTYAHMWQEYQQSIQWKI